MYIYKVYMQVIIVKDDETYSATHVTKERSWLEMYKVQFVSIFNKDN